MRGTNHRSSSRLTRGTAALVVSALVVAGGLVGALSATGSAQNAESDAVSDASSAQSSSHTSHLKRNSVKSKHIRKNAVRSSDIKNGQVKSADIGDNQVHSRDIRDGTIQPQDLAAGLLEGVKGDKGDTGDPGVSGLERVSAPIAYDAGDWLDMTGIPITVTCPEGKQAISVGYSIDGAYFFGILINRAYVTEAGHGEIVAGNTSGSTILEGVSVGTAYAMCATAPAMPPV